MKVIVPAIPICVGKCLTWIVLRRSTVWRALHQRLVGASIFFYGIYLATLTGTVTKLFLPGVGAIGGGAAAGVGAGLLTYALIGTVGVATGGVGIALGGFAMALIGGGFGIVGAFAGGIGFHTVTYPLVSPWFWGPILVLGAYVFVGASRKKALLRSQALLGNDNT